MKTPYVWKIQIWLDNNITTIGDNKHWFLFSKLAPKMDAYIHRMATRMGYVL